MQVVVFSDTNARIITNPPNIEDYKNSPRAVVDPDLSAVNGHPPHFWKYAHGRISLMDRAEQAERLQALGCDKSNAYTINEMFVRLSTVQAQVEDRDHEITRLNDELIKNAQEVESMRVDHSKKLQSAQAQTKSQLDELVDKHNKTIKRIERRAQRKYYLIMIISTVVGGIIGWMVLK